MSKRTSHQSHQWRMAWRKTVILVRHDHQPIMHPTEIALLGAGDTLAMLSWPEPLNHLLHDND